MKVLKNIAEWVALFLILLLSMGAFAESKKEASQDTAKYELKSDIINFNYTEMAYPVRDAKVGKQFTLVDKNIAPKKIVRGKDNTVSERDVTINSIVLPFTMVFITMLICSIFVLLLLFILTILQTIDKYYKKVIKKFGNSKKN